MCENKSKISFCSSFHFPEHRLWTCLVTLIDLIDAYDKFSIFFLANKASCKQISFYIFVLSSHVELPLIDYLIMFKYTDKFPNSIFSKIQPLQKVDKLYSMASSSFYMKLVWIIGMNFLEELLPNNVTEQSFAYLRQINIFQHFEINDLRY